MNKVVSALHDATHQVPGVPAHRESPHPHDPGRRLQNSDRSDRQHQTPQRHQTPPRVLIAWQNWIGGLVGRAKR